MEKPSPRKPPVESMGRRHVMQVVKRTYEELAEKAAEEAKSLKETKRKGAYLEIS